jgi:hypothetical protein
MNKKSDTVLRNMLKNWANRQRPPDNGRARLLWEAAQVSRNKIELTTLFIRPPVKFDPSSHPNDWPQTFFTWITENSLQLGLQARLS